MLISFKPNIQKIQYKPSLSINKKIQINSDVFIKSASFGQVNDGKSFAEFDRWAKDVNFKFHAREIIDDPNNYLGKDYQGHIYTIPDCDKWIIKKHQESHLMPLQVSETTYTEIDDISPTINIGQPIASLRVPYSPRITEHYYIHKAQEGGALGLQRGLMRNVSSGTVGKHLESLSKVAKLNKQTFDTLINEIQKISCMGYKFDGNEPNNLILDSNNKRINISGLSNDNKEKVGQYSEVLYALLGSDFSEKFNNSHRPDTEKQKAREYSDVICAKFLISMKNNQAKFQVTDNFKKLISSSTFSRILKTDDNKEKIIALRSAGLI